MNYVTVIGTGGKVVAVGKLIGYNGRWMRVRRNDNEEIAVNTDFVQAIHFMELPTQKMLESMARSVPIADDQDSSERSPMAVKQTSGRVGAPRVEEIVQNLVDSGPPVRYESSSGADIFALPRKVALPDGVIEDDGILIDRPKRVRKKHDSK